MFKKCLRGLVEWLEFYGMLKERSSGILDNPYDRRFATEVVFARAELLFTFFTLGHCFSSFIIDYTLHGFPATNSFEDKFMPYEVEKGI